MSVLRKRHGDATDPIGEGNMVICHVCNDSGAWGSGFVTALSARWMEPEARYREWHQQGAPGGFRLGAVQFVRVASSIWVANMIAQRGTRPKHGVPPIRYDYLETCLKQVAEQTRSLNATLHMPRIGSGLAGGDWSKIRRIVERMLTATGVRGTVYELP